jgi:hypothetical protein
MNPGKQYTVVMGDYLQESMIYLGKDFFRFCTGDVAKFQYVQKSEMICAIDTDGSGIEFYVSEEIKNMPDSDLIRNVREEIW